MANYSNEALSEKLKKLDQTQQSIETVSHWVLFHKSKYKYIVDVWNTELYKADTGKKLFFLYLANDVLQKSRKYGTDYSKQFSTVMLDALKHVYQQLAPKDHDRLKRLLDIWGERKVFTTSYVNSMRKALGLAVPVETSATPAMAALVKPASGGLSGSASSKLQPLVPYYAAVDQLLIGQDLLKDKVALIRPEHFSTDFIDPQAEQSKLLSNANAVEEDLHNVETYIASLTEETDRRTALVQALQEVIDKEEARMRDVAGLIQDLSSKRDKLTATKSKIYGTIKTGTGAELEQARKRRKLDDSTYVPTGNNGNGAAKSASSGLLSSLWDDTHFLNLDASATKTSGAKTNGPTSTSAATQSDTSPVDMEEDPPTPSVFSEPQVSPYYAQSPYSASPYEQQPAAMPSLFQNPYATVQVDPPPAPGAQLVMLQTAPGLGPLEQPMGPPLQPPNAVPQPVLFISPYTQPPLDSYTQPGANY